MPKPKDALNAFPPKRAAEIVGMSVHMLNYLARRGYLVPNYDRSGNRGKTRYYSFRDLVIARLVQKLLDVGLEIKRLKAGIKNLPRVADLSNDDPQNALRLLATDGSSLFFIERNGSLLDLTHQGQLAFAFVLDAAIAQAEVKKELKPEELVHFTLRNLPRKYA